MNRDPQIGESPRTLCIQGELNIFRASELKQALLAEPAPAEIDLSGVTEIDTAGLQLLMLVKKHARRSGREVRLVAHSAAVIELFEMLHIAGYFGDQMVIDAASRGTSHRT